MARAIFQDPSHPYEDDGQLTVQVHAPLPERVQIGHFEAGGREVVDEVVDRAEYLARIRNECRKHGEKLWVRFYAHHGEDEFDASVLGALDEVHSLAIDTYCPVANAEAVGWLPRLKRLRYSPRGTTNPNILGAFGVQRLEYFTLGETAIPLIDLSPLAEAGSMQTLRLLARGKNVEAIGNCTSLIELAIHPSEKFSLDCINRLAGLKVLKFVLGRIESIEAVGPLPKLQDLSFKEVRLLERLGDLQRFPNLCRLQLEDQKRIARLDAGAANRRLEHIRLYGVPALERIYGLSELPALKSLWAYDSRLEPSWSDLPPQLTHFQLVAKHVKGRKEHEEAVRARGLIPEPHRHSQFFYK